MLKAAMSLESRFPTRHYPYFCRANLNEMVNELFLRPLTVPITASSSVQLDATRRQLVSAN